MAKWANGCHMPSFPKNAEMRRPRTSDGRSPCTWGPQALKRDAGIPGRHPETVPTKGRHAIMRTSRFTGASLGLRQGIIHWLPCLSSFCTAHCTVPESWMNLRSNSQDAMRHGPSAQCACSRSENQTQLTASWCMQRACAFPVRLR